MKVWIILITILALAYMVWKEREKKLNKMVNKNKKGGTAWLWLFGIVIIFVGIISYIVIDQGYSIMYDKLYPQLSAEAKIVADKNDSIWNNVPIFIVLGGALMMVVGAFYNEPDTGGVY